MENTLPHNNIEAFRSALNTLPMPWLLLNRRADIVECNEAAILFYNLSKSALLAKNYSELNTHFTTSVWETFWHELKEKKTGRYTRKLPSPGNAGHMVELVASYIETDADNFCQFLKYVVTF